MGEKGDNRDKMENGKSFSPQRREGRKGLL
jgi:hypothetical protein